MNQATNPEEDLMVIVSVHIGIIRANGEIIPAAAPQFLVDVANNHPDKQSRVFARLFLNRLKELKDLHAAQEMALEKSPVVDSDA